MSSGMFFSSSGVFYLAQGRLEHVGDILDRVRDVLGQLWDVLEPQRCSEHCGAVGGGFRALRVCQSLSPALCCSSRAARSSSEEQSGAIRRHGRSWEGILHVQSLWGSLKGRGGVEEA